MDQDRDLLLTPGEVAERFRVDPKTVVRWAKSGKLRYIKTLGGHHRFRESEVSAALAYTPGEAAAGDQAAA